MVNDDLNAPKIGSVLSLERNREIQVGIDSCAAATVFAHFCWFVTKSCKSCVDLSARKVTCELRDVSFWCLNLKNGDDVRSLGGSVRERHESRCVLPLLRRRYLSACVPRGMWNETGAGAKRSLRVASRDCFGQCSDDKLELIAFGAGTDQGHDDHDCKFRAPAMPETCKTVSVSPAGKVQAWSLVVGGNPAKSCCGPSDSKSRTVGRATGGLRSERGNATRRIATSSGG